MERNAVAGIACGYQRRPGRGRGGYGGGSVNRSKIVNTKKCAAVAVSTARAERRNAGGTQGASTGAEVETMGVGGGRESGDRNSWSWKTT